MSEINSPTSPTTVERKRNNSIIPFEFRNDTSDGGMERAALATVFGVREYTESKIFWNNNAENDQQQQVDLYHSPSEDFSIHSSITSITAAQTPITTSTINAANSSSFKPVVLVGGGPTSLLQRNSSKKSYTQQQQHHNHNSVLQQPPAPLPVIPVVSEFGDIWNEVNKKHKEKRRSNMQHLLTDKDFVDHSSLKIQVEEGNTIQPIDLSDSPITLFDLIKPDENPNFILWGIVKPTTIPPTAPPSTTVVENDDASSIVSTSNKKKKFRWSTAQHIIPGSIKIIKKAASSSFHHHHDSEEVQGREKRESIASSAYTKEHQQPEEEESRVIEAATIEKLIEKLTISLGKVKKLICEMK